MSDGSFFREVDEAVRHERYRMLWDRFGLLIIGAAALIVVSIAGYNFYVYWQEQRDQEAGARFVEAVTLSEAGETDKAREALQALAEDGPAGYEALSRLRLAAADAKAGKTAEAVAAFEAIAGDSGIDNILRDNARIQAATLRLPEADHAEMQERVGGLIESDSPWKYSARDLLGLSAYKQGDMDAAQQQFNALLIDSGTPSNLREQATMMLALIMGAGQAGQNNPAETKSE